MKKYIILIVQILCAFTFSYGQGVKFRTFKSWEETKQTALREGKEIFVDVYATWCVPCKQLDENVFSDPSIGNFIDSNYIAIKVQQDRSGNDETHIKEWYKDAALISQKYEVNAMPTMLVVRGSGKLAGKLVGYRDKSEFLKEIRRINSDSRLFEKGYSAFEQSPKDSSLVFGLVKRAKDLGLTEEAHHIASTYINGLGESEKFVVGNLRFIYDNTQKSSDPGFVIFFKQGKTADDALKFPFRNPSKAIVSKIIYKEEIEQWIQKDNVNWVAVERNIAKKFGRIDPEYYNGLRMFHAMNTKSWVEFGKYYELYFKSAYSHSAYHINNMSYNIFLHSNNPRIIGFAAKTIKYSIDHFDQNNYGAYDTYASLLYKLGNVKEAITWQEKAVQGAPQEKEIAENLSKMKRGEKIW